MKLTIILLILIIPTMISFSEFNSVVTWNAGIEIDMTGVPADKINRVLYKKGW